MNKLNRPSPLARLSLWLYCLYLILPLYWLLTMALRSNQEILGSFTWWPTTFTLVNFTEVFTNPVWRDGLINSLTYVVLNTGISIVVAVPAAYVFSRFRFLGDKQLFFWLLTNRMAPPAVFLLPFFQLYS
jgi:glycerol transport system permease protein